MVTVYIDAAYGVNLGSGKSHSGYTVLVGLGPLGVSCTKQKIVTKSSTESELVALSDYASAGIHLKNFLLIQGYEVVRARLCRTIPPPRCSSREEGQELRVRSTSTSDFSS